MLAICMMAVLVTSVTGAWTECNQPCGGGQRSDPARGWTISCNTFSCTNLMSCLCGETDLVFVLDGSRSVGPYNFWVQKQFVVDVVRGLHTHGGKAARKTRVGMVGFGNKGYIEFNLNGGYTFGDIDALTDRIWAMNYVAQFTNTSGGLYMAKKVFDSQKAGNKKQVSVVMTDGRSNRDRHLTIPMAQELLKYGVGVFAIGIGRVDANELTAIASQPTSEFYYYVNNYAAISRIVNDVLKGTCCNIKPPECTITNIIPCKGTCNDGKITVETTCKHFDYYRNETKTEVVYERRGADVCYHQHKLHVAGSNWTVELEEGRTKQCFCPTVPPSREEWTEKKYCTAFCDDDGIIHQTGDMWDAIRGGSDVTCRCNDFGQIICKKIKDDECVISNVAHAPGETWIQDVSAGRHKECTCPANGKFKKSRDCKDVCMVDGKMYIPEVNGTFSKIDQNTGLSQDCECNKHGNVKCFNTAVKGCSAGGKLYPAGGNFTLDVNKGRKKMCKCPDNLPPATAWNIGQFCTTICIVNGATHYGGTTFDMVDPTTGKTDHCECKPHGVVKC